MSHFNRKTATFYGIAIGSVLILFKIITAYGESNLKAPPFIGGSYQLQVNPQANCSNPGKVLLLIEQSGIYLNATLLPNESSKAVVEYPKFFPLSGKLQQQQLKLVGTIANLNICSYSPTGTASSRAKNPATDVQIQAEFVGRDLQGKITLNSQSQSLKFTAFNSLAQ